MTHYLLLVTLLVTLFCLIVFKSLFKKALNQSLQKKFEQKTEKLTKTLQIVSETKDRFEGAFEYSAIGIALVSLEGKWLRVNNALSNILGYSKEEFDHLTFQDVTHPDDLSIDLDYVQQMLEGEILTYQMDKRYYHKAGHELWAQLNVSLVKGEDGKPLYFVSQIQDVTRVRNIEQAKTEFVSLASHQLRTPLTSLNWTSELLMQSAKEGSFTQQQRGHIHTIYESSHRMSQLVNNLLEVSRLELGTFQVHTEEIAIQEIVTRIITELEPIAVNKKITLIKKMDKDIPKMYMDRQLLFIIIQNITENALKYTQEGGEVTINVATIKEELVISISDTGYGIPSDQHNLVFTKLFRAENILSKDTDGTGLGLYIVKKIIDNTGGVINFVSEVDQGTTFTVRYPLSGMNSSL